MTVALWINQALIDVALGVLIVLAAGLGNWIKTHIVAIYDLLALRNDPDMICQFIHPPPQPGTAEQAEAIRAGLAADLADWEQQQPPQDPPKRQPCKGFQWIGQSFAHCDGCGLPFWEHTHDTRLAPGAGPFDDEPFDYVLISDDTKAKVKARWEGQ